MFLERNIRTFRLRQQILVTKKKKKEAPAKAPIAPGLGESDRQIGPPPPMMNGNHRDEEVIQPVA